MVYLVWGHGRMYYLLSSRAADAGDNGSVNLLIWTAISGRTAADVTGSRRGLTSGTARFLSRFGGTPDMRLIARRSRFYTGRCKAPSAD